MLEAQINAILSVALGLFSIALGVFVLWYGTSEIWKGFRLGTFHGRFGIEYQEKRGSVMFWISLLLRIFIYPAAGLMIWFGVSTI